MATARENEILTRVGRDTQFASVLLRVLFQMIDIRCHA